MKLVKLTLFVIVLALVAAAGRYVYRARRVKAAQPCWGNLVQLEAAKDQWAIENGAAPGSTVTISNVLPYIKGSQMPKCNVDTGTYTIGRVGEDPKCTVHGTSSRFNYDRY